MNRQGRRRAPAAALVMGALLVYGGCANSRGSSSPPAPNPTPADTPGGTPIERARPLALAATTTARVAAMTASPATAEPLEVALLAAARKLQDMRIPYARGTADSVAMLRRLVKAIEAQSPGLVPLIPDYMGTASALAEDRAERGTYTVITDPLAQDRYLQTGMILFFGQRGATGPRAVEHLGVLVSVEYGDDGTIARYQMFQARSASRPAAITNFHQRVPSRGTYPPFGDGELAWIGASPLAP